MLRPVEKEVERNPYRRAQPWTDLQETALQFNYTADTYEIFAEVKGSVYSLASNCVQFGEQSTGRSMQNRT